MYKPTENGRASICEWEIELRFRKEEQVRNLIRSLVNYEFMFDFEYEKDLDDTSTIHTVTVRGNWATHLTAIAEMANSVDYVYE